MIILDEAHNMEVRTLTSVTVALVLHVQASGSSSASLVPCPFCIGGAGHETNHLHGHKKIVCNLNIDHQP